MEIIYLHHIPSNIFGRQSHFCCWLFAVLYKIHINRLFCRSGKVICTHTRYMRTHKKAGEYFFWSPFLCTSHEIFGHGSFEQKQQRERMSANAFVCVMRVPLYFILLYYNVCLSLFLCLIQCIPFNRVYKRASERGRKSE